LLYLILSFPMTRILAVFQASARGHTTSWTLEKA
jgi:hypothetical protein